MGFLSGMCDSDDYNEDGTIPFGSVRTIMGHIELKELREDFSVYATENALITAAKTKALVLLSQLHSMCSLVADAAVPAPSDAKGGGKGQVQELSRQAAGKGFGSHDIPIPDNNSLGGKGTNSPSDNLASGPRANIAQSNAGFSPNDISDLLKGMQKQQNDFMAEKYTSQQCLDSVGDNTSTIPIPAGGIPVLPSMSHVNPEDMPPPGAISHIIHKQQEGALVVNSFPGGEQCTIPKCCVRGATLTRLTTSRFNVGKKYCEQWLHHDTAFFFDSLTRFLYMYCYVFSVKNDVSSGHALFSPVDVRAYMRVLYHIAEEHGLFTAVSYDRALRNQLAIQENRWVFAENSTQPLTTPFHAYVSSHFASRDQAVFAHVLIAGKGKGKGKGTDQDPRGPRGGGPDNRDQGDGRGRGNGRGQGDGRGGGNGRGNGRGNGNGGGRPNNAKGKGGRPGGRPRDNRPDNRRRDSPDPKRRREDDRKTSPTRDAPAAKKKGAP